MLIAIRQVRDKDLFVLQKLIKEGMKEEIFKKTIFSSLNYTKFIKSTLSIPENRRKVKFFGAYNHETLAGFAEFRILDKSIFLNNIYVDSSLQGNGIGRCLMETGYELMEIYKKSKLVLDVFSDNTKALSWYEKENFKIINETNWLLGDQGKPISGCNECIIENFIDSQANQKLFNFSILKIKTNGAAYEIGRINDNLYRITNLGALQDKDVLSKVYSLDPNRKLLLVTEEKEYPNFKIVCTSIRMEKNIGKGEF